MSAFELDLLPSPTGVPVGFGPIVTGQFFDIETSLDKAGAVSFDMPRADIKSDLIAERQIIRCSTMRGGQWIEIGRGQIEDLTEDMSADQVALLEVGASDDLIALAGRTVGNLLLSDSAHGHNENPMPKADILAAIFAFAPAGWTVIGVPSEDVYLPFASESVLAALGKLASQLGDHFRLDSGLTVTWLPKTTPPVASGIRAMSHIPNPTTIGSDTCLMTRLQRKRDASKQASRVYAYGGGNSDARVTLSSSSSSYVAPTYVLPAGYSYGNDSIGAYIKNDAADAANRIDAIQTFQDVAAMSTATGHALSATNALAQTAVTWLARHVDVYYSYDLDVTAASQAILSGQTIRVVADQYLAGRRIPVVDADLLVLGVKKRLDAEGTARIVSLTVANSDRWPEDDDHMVAGNAIRTQSQSSHLQVASRALNADTAAAVIGQVFDAGVGIHKSTNTSITSGAWTALTWDVEDWDSAADYWTGSSALIAQTAGTYAIDGGVEFANNATGNRGVRIRVNAATYIKETFVPAATGTGTTVLAVSTTYKLAAADVVRLEVWQDSGIALNVLSTSNYSPTLRMIKLGA